MRIKVLYVFDDKNKVYFIEDLYQKNNLQYYFIIIGNNNLHRY